MDESSAERRLAGKKLKVEYEMVTESKEEASAVETTLKDTDAFAKAMKASVTTMVAEKKIPVVVEAIVAEKPTLTEVTKEVTIIITTTAAATTAAAGTGTKAAGGTGGSKATAAPTAAAKAASSGGSSKKEE